MVSQSLIAHHAIEIATVVMEIVGPCLRDDEKAEAFALFAEAAKATLEKYEMLAERMDRRMNPSPN
ncbi:hypothetical protein [Zavarzinella formosa]|uniref:hypothetical protein n=1 Tax=Zavarzinella formosa TaxID=360055 RepID=UPI00031322B0|nr:hypothetical protein [Zavarzinella formosa]